MNKSIVFAAALAACVGSVSAQSSVSVFGVVDLAGRMVSNDETQYQLANGGMQTSRLGFRGTEDLGGGLSAGFWLEGELQADTGNSSGFNFMRRSTVSLSSKAAGELRLGRDKVATGYEWDEFDPFRDAGVGRSSRLSVIKGIVPAGGAYNTFTRANNTISYFLPGTLGGLFGQATVAAGEGSLGNKYAGGRLGYKADALVVSGSYGNTQVTEQTDAKFWNVGGTFDLKAVKLWGFFSSLEIGDASQDNWLLGATMPIGSFELRASYQSMEGGGTLNDNEAWMAAVGGVYSLSRRTALYATYSTISNTNTAITVASGSPLTKGSDSSGFEIGVRHSF